MHASATHTRHNTLVIPEQKHTQRNENRQEVNQLLPMQTMHPRRGIIGRHGLGQQTLSPIQRATGRSRYTDILFPLYNDASVVELLVLMLTLLLVIRVSHPLRSA